MFTLFTHKSGTTHYKLVIYYTFVDSLHVVMNSEKSAGTHSLLAISVNALSGIQSDKSSKLTEVISLLRTSLLNRFRQISSMIRILISEEDACLVQSATNSGSAFMSPLHGKG